MQAPQGRLAATPRQLEVERLIGRLLVWLTYISVGLLVAGVVLMLVERHLAPRPSSPFDPASIVADVTALRPVGFLWLGLMMVIATPILRVLVAGLGYARDRDWTMVLVAIGILVVIAVGVATAALTEV